MLILARRTGQKIVIGGDIEITVTEVRGDHVRLGITAPRGLAVYRKELLEQIAEGNREAAKAAQVAAGDGSGLDLNDAGRHHSL